MEGVVNAVDQGGGRKVGEAGCFAASAASARDRIPCLGGARGGKGSRRRLVDGEEGQQDER